MLTMNMSQIPGNYGYKNIFVIVAVFTKDFFIHAKIIVKQQPV